MLIIEASVVRQKKSRPGPNGPRCKSQSGGSDGCGALRNGATRSPSILFGHTRQVVGASYATDFRSSRTDWGSTATTTRSSSSTALPRAADEPLSFPARSRWSLFDKRRRGLDASLVFSRQDTRGQVRSGPPPQVPRSREEFGRCWIAGGVKYWRSRSPETWG